MWKYLRRISVKNILGGFTIGLMACCIALFVPVLTELSSAYISSVYEQVKNNISTFPAVWISVSIIIMFYISLRILKFSQSFYRKNLSINVYFKGRKNRYIRMRRLTYRKIKRNVLSVFRHSGIQSYNLFTKTLRSFKTGTDAPYAIFASIALGGITSLISVLIINFINITHGLDKNSFPWTIVFTAFSAPLVLCIWHWRHEHKQKDLDHVQMSLDYERQRLEFTERQVNDDLLYKAHSTR